MNPMVIEWQRLIDRDGQTCERCSCTGEETEAAFAKLKRSLAEVGIEVRLEKRSISHAVFVQKPLESNQVLIDGRTIEEWIGATTGQSPCCGPCGDNECRTVNIDNLTYEVLPEKMILRAGFLAAAEKFK